ncbi:MAG: replication-associated recombination protein A [Dehalococcoidia bacterium]|nr:replication-associated recombination protein A [Dehalococcoidia bacterium]
MALFEHARQARAAREAPLAARIRPRTFDEFVGQEHIIGPGRVLRKAIEADRLPSIIFWGPPGTGKTTLALLIAQATKSHFEALSAVSAGVADLRKAVEQAKERRGQRGERTILFVDEIHRFNKGQQDAILPYVEDGTITFIGATTENPSFEVNAPLLSRCRVFTLHQLTDDEVREIVTRALADTEHGLGNMHVEVDSEALTFLITFANGDARIALNALELAADNAKSESSVTRHVTLAIVEDALQQRALVYDKAGDNHYDTISAFIKCVRSSDPDAAVYWLARMLEAGEDPMFIARRLIILASEDIGMADPHALPLAVAAQQAVHFIGLPEGAIPLAEATVYLATAPKSNASYMALNKAREDVQKTRNAPVPMHLRNAPTQLMKNLGYGKGYQYAHDAPGHFVQMQNLPDALKGRIYYGPSDQGYEVTVAERIKKWWGDTKGR